MTLPLKRVENILILEKVGLGNQGQVNLCKLYERHHSKDKNQSEIPILVCVKAISKATESTLKYAQREIDTLFSLSHINIVKYIHSVQTINNFYLVMEYVQGRNLKEVQDSGNIKEEDARSYISQMCNTFRFLYPKQIIHRDIKPANVLLEEKTGLLKVCDFGFARKYEPQDLFLTTVGTPVFAAPQFFIGEGFTHKCDVWSCGIMFYCWLYGRFPFDLEKLKSLPTSKIGKNLLETSFEFPDSKFPKFYAELLKGMLGKQEVERWSWPEVLNFLEENDVERIEDSFVTNFLVNRGGNWKHRISKKENKRALTLELLASSPEIAQKAQAHFEKLIKLEHANLMKIRHCARVHDRLFVYYKEYSDETLDSLSRSYYAEEDPSFVDKQLCIVRQLINFYRFLQKHQITHGQLRATNIYIDHYLVKVSNLGLSKFTNGSEDMLEYLHPDFDYQKCDVDGWTPREDLWSLMILLHQTIIGKNPMNWRRYNVDRSTVSYLLDEFRAYGISLCSSGEYAFLWKPLTMPAENWDSADLDRIEKELTIRENDFFSRYVDYSRENKLLILTFNKTLILIKENEEALKEALKVLDHAVIELLITLFLQIKMEDGYNEFTAHGYISIVANHERYDSERRDWEIKLESIYELKNDGISYLRDNHPDDPIVKKLVAWSADPRLFKQDINSEYCKYIGKLEPLFQAHQSDNKVRKLAGFMRLLSSFDKEFDPKFINYRKGYEKGRLSQIFFDVTLRYQGGQV